MSSDGEDKWPSETDKLNDWGRLIVLFWLFRQQGSSNENEQRVAADYDIEAQRAITTTRDPQESCLRKFWREFKAFVGTFKEVLDRQDMPKHATSLAIPIGTAIAIMYQKDPKSMTAFMQVVVSFLSIGLTALWIGILLSKKSPSYGFRITLVGYMFIFGSFFGLFSFLLMPQFTACIPIACWMIINLLLVAAFFHG